MDESEKSELVFAAFNVHIAQCGTAPGITNRDRPGDYHGYFENLHGEQWVFTYDRQRKLGTLQGGDVRWGKKYEIQEGKVNVVLDPFERAWLTACWAAATHWNS